VLGGESLLTVAKAHWAKPSHLEKCADEARLGVNQDLSHLTRVRYGADGAAENRRPPALIPAPFPRPAPLNGLVRRVFYTFSAPVPA